MFQRCAICTDFTDGMHRLIHFVPSLAAAGLKEIVFFHSVPYLDEGGGLPREDEEAIAAAKERLSTALNDVPSGVQVQVQVASGRPLDTIPRLVESEDIEVILTGTPSRSLLEEKIFGSTSMGLARNVHPPLLIIRPQLITTYRQEELHLRAQHLWSYLMIPYNDTNETRYVIEQVKKCVQSQPEHTLQKCLLVWLVEDSGRRDFSVENRLEKGRQKTETVKGELEALGLQVETVVQSSSNVLTTALDIALERDISAIAVGACKGGGFLKWTLPNIAQDVLHNSWFPVLFFSEND